MRSAQIPVKFDRRIQPPNPVFSPKDHPRIAPQLQPQLQPQPQPQKPQEIAENTSSEDEMSVQTIIATKPEPKIVREFFKFNINGISDD